MQVACPSCAHVITVPAERAAVPNLKAKCRCGHLFAVASVAEAAGPEPVSFDPPGPSTGVVRVAAANADRVAEIRAANARAAAAFAAADPGGVTLKPPPLSPRPAGAPAARPTAAAAAVARPAASRSGSGAIPATTAAAERPHSLPIPWRRCQNHPQVRSEHVCPNCAKGFCGECVQKVQDAATCPSCGGPGVAAAAYEEMQDKARQLERSMMDEIGVIAGYPLGDTRAFVLLSLFPWFLGLACLLFTRFFGLFAGFAGVMTLLSKVVLTWYSFHALSKVSVGHLRDLMPDFRNPSAIAHSMRLSLAALLISAGPFFLFVFLIPGASVLTGGDSFAGPSPFEAQREGGSIVGPIVMLGIVIAVIWMVAYLPIALTVAARTRRMLSTLSPAIGVDTIKKMGGTYWQALAIYLAIVVGQTVAAYVLGLIPFAGSLAAAFVNAYAALAIGCTLGLAVFKRATELGWY
ncbi:MAG TPA: hypothetical protein VFT38_04315 [Vicinamibacteria bacterium]|nr:hypothetical protein [Vicinamibacteria bacterium]